MGLGFDTGRLKQIGEGRTQNSKRKIKGPVDLSHSSLLLSSFMPFFLQAMSNPGLLTPAGSCGVVVNLDSGEGRDRAEQWGQVEKRHHVFWLSCTQKIIYVHRSEKWEV